MFIDAVYLFIKVSKALLTGRCALFPSGTPSSPSFFIRIWGVVGFEPTGGSPAPCGLLSIQFSPRPHIPSKYFFSYDFYFFRYDFLAGATVCFPICPALIAHYHPAPATTRLTHHTSSNFLSLLISYINRFYSVKPTAYSIVPHYARL
jgi:hypothetical protein